VIDDTAVVEGKPVRVDAGGASVLLYRQHGEVLAIGDRCTHAGGPLHEGEVETSSGTPCVKCPWHHSVFDLRDGSVVHGPATVPEPSYAVRTINGKIEVRVR
jgi:nitrite reductase/ring-hydroxylating ferredoxin subunit